jgi:hypothetical protein
MSVDAALRAFNHARSHIFVNTVDNLDLFLGVPSSSMYANPAAAMTSLAHTPRPLASSELAISQTTLSLGAPFES